MYICELQFVFQVEAEVGRFMYQRRKDTLCNVNVTEDELHFVFHCLLQDEARQLLFQKMQSVKPDQMR